MPGVKTNERPGTRAVARFVRVSPSKVREVLDLVRGQHVARAEDTLVLCDRDAAIPVAKVLRSAVANAENNDGLDPEELYVSACFADEGPTLKRYRYRARGKADRIRKRTCHITIIVSRLPDEELRRFRARQEADASDRRARRVAGGRRGRRGAQEPVAEPEAIEAEQPTIEEPTIEATEAEDTAAEATETEQEIVEDSYTEGSDAQGESSEDPVESGALEDSEAGGDDVDAAEEAEETDGTPKEEEQ